MILLHHTPCLELWSKIGKTDGKVPETRIAYGNEVAPPTLKFLEKRLADAGGQFYHGAKPGFADVWLLAYAAFFTSGFFDHLPTDFISTASPTLAALIERVKASELYEKYGTPN